ncbi:MAG: hypothetical protein WCP13_01890 [Nitrosomonadaceae bacterium]
MSDIIAQIDKDEIEVFRHLAYTMGNMIIFPSNRVDGKSTINGARGFHPPIKDRIDLTLECIRRFYLNEASPLSETLGRYKSFFELFDNFQGYAEFFLFQDLVTNDFSAIKFFMPFRDFKTPAVPKTLESYISYKGLVIDYINSRNQRILRVPTESRSALLFENREQNRIGMRRKRGEFRYATDEVAHAELAHAPRGAGESQK